MLTRKLIQTFAALAVFSLSVSAQAFSTIDGNLADWGVMPSGSGSTSGSSADFTPFANIHYAVEDQTGSLSTYLNPGYGGQRYDAEALYTTWDAQYLYIAIATGLPSNNADYAPGDIGLDFDGDGVYEFGMETTGNNGNTVGGLYSVSDWGHGLSNWSGVSDPTSILNGTLLDIGSLVYTNPGSPMYGLGEYAGSDRHYIIESRIALSNFANWGNDFDLHWTMNCGNDAIDLAVTSLPEPSSGVLIGLGFLGVAGLRRRRSKQA